ncbi:phenylacetate--CoA ligase [Hymenobacter saemangeumensis]|uniref:Phenylacetate--CoA ligase n=1 Tax=Hymenobacter saemangeumensis TaxID=1084522 RepID=A0ABP8IT39_9BACT
MSWKPNSKSLEFASPEEIADYQLPALRRQLDYLAAHSPFYRSLFEQHGIDVARITTLVDLARLPVTTKTDLQRRNWDFLCVPRSQVAEYCSTSGTLGLPVTICLTRADLDRLYYNEFLSFACADGRPDDVYQLMLTLDRQFMAGVAYYGGILRSGASAIRLGPGNIKSQLDTILQLRPTVLVGVPSFISTLVGYAREVGIDLNSTSVQRIICIGESIRREGFEPNALAEKITGAWNVQLYSTYASTEKQTAFTECGQGRGGHHQPELLLFEILDEQDQVLPAGRFGELTITTLGVEGMPLLRYKTGDICAYYDEPCACGRTTRRLSPIVGRKQQLIKYKGTTVYPQAIFNALNTQPDVAAYVVEAFTSDMGTDELKISLALHQQSDAVVGSIRQALQASLRVLPTLQVLPLAQVLAMQNSENKRKPSSFIDQRRIPPPA